MVSRYFSLSATRIRCRTGLTVATVRRPVKYAATRGLLMVLARHLFRGQKRRMKDSIIMDQERRMKMDQYYNHAPLMARRFEDYYLHYAASYITVREAHNRA